MMNFNSPPISLTVFLKDYETNEPLDSFIGNDVVYLPDFEKSLNPLFIKKVYTTKEIAYCEAFKDKIQPYASTWAAKEAAYKVIKQVYPEALGFKRIEILRKEIGGMPEVHIHGHPAAQHHCSLSISHDGVYVWAVAILQGLKLNK